MNRCSVPKSTTGYDTGKCQIDDDKDGKKTTVEKCQLSCASGFYENNPSAECKTNNGTFSFRGADRVLELPPGKDTNLHLRVMELAAVWIARLEHRGMIKPTKVRVKK